MIIKASEHDVVIDVDEDGHGRLTCTRCQTTKMRHPLMTDDEVWRWKIIEFDLLHPTKKVVDGRDR
ncbi:MAG: hypothetical protein WAV25_00825 [Minisyncoccia bacterium]